MLKAILWIMVAILVLTALALFSVYWFDLDAKLLRAMEKNAKS